MQPLVPTLVDTEATQTSIFGMQIVLIQQVIFSIVCCEHISQKLFHIILSA